MRRKDHLVLKLEEKFPKVAIWVDENMKSYLTVFHLPVEHRRKMKSTIMLERFNEELRRRSRVVRIFPSQASCLRLAAALCQETSEILEMGRRYLNFDIEQEASLSENDEKDAA